MTNLFNTERSKKIRTEKNILITFTNHAPNYRDLNFLTNVRVHHQSVLHKPNPDRSLDQHEIGRPLEKQQDETDSPAYPRVPPSGHVALWDEQQGRRAPVVPPATVARRKPELRYLKAAHVRAAFTTPQQRHLFVAVFSASWTPFPRPGITDPSLRPGPGSPQISGSPCQLPRLRERHGWSLHHGCLSPRLASGQETTAHVKRLVFNKCLRVYIHTCIRLCQTLCKRLAWCLLSRVKIG